MTPDEFIQTIGDTAGKICADYNLPASVCIAQAAIESGWGESVIGNYNYFGRKWGGTGDYVTLPTQEYTGGGYVTEYAKFQSYGSLEEAIQDWCILITEEPCYQPAIDAWHRRWNVEDFVYALGPIYATDPDYADKVMSTIRANNLMRFDGWND